MKLHFIRNAAMVLETGNHHILVDPCLGRKGSLPPYAVIRRPPRMNPTAALPENTDALLKPVTAGLLTHFRGGHWDHLDRAGARFLAASGVETYCGNKDAPALAKKGIKARGLKPNQRQPFLNGFITPVPMAHGRGLEGFLMGPGLGYFLEMPEEPSVYIAGDTVLTGRVKEVLRDLKPGISVVNAGSPILDFGKPIIFSLAETLEFVQLAPGKVVAVHMDSFNHCQVSRKILKETLTEQGLSHKVIIPLDGETVDL